MEHVIKQFDFVVDGFFYFFGFTANPAEKQAKEIIEDTPADKIRSDLKRVNSDYRKKYLEMKKELACVE